MNRLDELPLIQRIALVVLSLVLIGASGYFLLITDVQQQILVKSKEAATARKEVQDLSPYQAGEAVDRLIAEEKVELARIEQNRKMLPTRDELPAFIDSIKGDADSVGLQIMRFEVGYTDLEDYYAEIPIEVRVLGTFPKMVAFLRTLAAPAKRIVNVRGMDVKRLQPDLNYVMKVLGDNDLTRKLSSLRAMKDTFKPEYSTLMSILELEAIHSLGLISANFTVVAFSYTGKLAPEDARKRQSQRRRGR